MGEPFGPTVGECFSEGSAGKRKRLKFLCSELGLPYPPPEHVRYQLFHQPVSAILKAKRFRASDAVMVVHSFSPKNEWHEDYQAFLGLFGLEGGVDEAVSTRLPSGLPLHFAWVREVPAGLSGESSLLRQRTCRNAASAFQRALTAARCQADREVVTCCQRGVVAPFAGAPSSPITARYAPLNRLLDTEGRWNR